MATAWESIRRRLDREALLNRLGLEERSPGADVLTGLGLFSLGVLVGAGLGLVFAPKRGEDMRAMMAEAWRTRGTPRGPDYQAMGAETAPPAGR